MNAAFLLLLVSQLLGSPGVASSAPGPCTVRAQVVDTEGVPVASARLGAEPATRNGWRRDRDPPVHADARGWVTLRLGRGVYRWAVASDRHPTTGEGILDLRSSCEAASLGRVVVEPGKTLSGQVVGAEGKPLAGATVKLPSDPATPSYLDETDGIMIRPARQVSTGADGRFELPGLAPGTETWIFTLHPGYRTDRRRVTAPDEPLEIALDPAAQLTVEVVDGDGAPLDGAEVRLESIGAAEPASELVRLDQVTGPAGRWTAASVEPGETEITVTASGYERGRRVVDLAAGEERTERFELAAVPSGPVAVRVVDDRGTAVSGAQVSLAELPRRAGGLFETGRSDEEGRISWPRVPLGHYELTVQVPSGAPAERAEPVRLEVAGPPVEREVVLRRLPGRAVEGSVVGPSDEGVSGVEILAYSEGVPFGTLRATSGPDGSFGFDHVPYGTYRVNADVPGVAGVPVKRFRVEREPEPWRLRVPGGVEVSGRLLLPRGLAPDGSWTISARRDDGDGGAGGWLEGERSYRLAPLAPGSWTVTAKSGRLEGRAKLEVEAGRAPVRRDITIEAPEEGFTAFGTLTHQGAPLSGARVSLSAQTPQFATHSTTTDASGAFEFPDLRAGEYAFGVGWQGVSVLQVVVRLTGPSDLSRELDFARVRGRVEIDGVDPSVLSIRCGYLGPGDAEQVYVVTSGGYPGSIRPRPDGTFEVGPLRGGRWMFSVDPPGHAPLEREVVIAGDDVDDLVLAPEPTPGLTFRLVSQSGTLPAHVSATYRWAEGDRQMHLFFQPTEPTVEWSSVPVGRGTLELKTDFVKYGPIPVEVPGPPVEIALPPRGTIEVYAPLVDDDQLGEVRITLRSLDATDREPKSVPLSRHVQTLFDLRPGLYELTLQAADGESWSEVVEVRDQETTRVRLE